MFVGKTVTVTEVDGEEISSDLVHVNDLTRHHS